MFSIKKFWVLGLLGAVVFSAPVEAKSSVNNSTGGSFGGGVAFTVATYAAYKAGLFGWLWKLVVGGKGSSAYNNFVTAANQQADAAVTAETSAMQLKQGKSFTGLTPDQVAETRATAIGNFVVDQASEYLGVDTASFLKYVNSFEGSSLLQKLQNINPIVDTLTVDNSVTKVATGLSPEEVNLQALRYAVKNNITTVSQAGSHVDAARARAAANTASTGEDVSSGGGFSSGTGRGVGSTVNSGADDFAQLRTGLAQAGRAGGRMMSNATQAAAKQVQQGINDLAVQVEQATRVRGAGQDFDPVKPTAPTNEDVVEPIDAV